MVIFSMYVAIFRCVVIPIYLIQFNLLKKKINRHLYSGLYSEINNTFKGKRNHNWKVPTNRIFMKLTLSLVLTFTKYGCLEARIDYNYTKIVTLCEYIAFQTRFYT